MEKEGVYDRGIYGFRRGISRDILGDNIRIILGDYSDMIGRRICKVWIYFVLNKIKDKKIKIGWFFFLF